MFGGVATCSALGTPSSEERAVRGVPPPHPDVLPIQAKSATASHRRFGPIVRTEWHIGAPSPTASGDDRVNDARGRGHAMRGSAWNLDVSARVNDDPIGRGGLAYRCCQRLGPSRAGLSGPLALVAFIYVVCLAPLVVMSAADGALLGARVKVPLSRDYVTLARFLVAMPLLALSVPISDIVLRTALTYFVASGLVGADRRTFDALLVRARTVGDSRWIDAAIFVVLLGVAALAPMSLMEPYAHDSWFARDGTMRPAGYWYNWISLLLFRELLAQWLWRLGLWAWLMWRLSRRDLELCAGHPDGCAGLAPMGDAQRAFGPFVVANGVLVGASCAERLLYGGATIDGLKFLLLNYVVLAVVLSTAPALVWMDRLWRFKRDAVHAYEALGAHATRCFEARWLDRHEKIGAEAGAELLGTDEASTMNDFGEVHANVRAMSLVPLRHRTWLGLALAASLPLVLALGVTTPLEETAKTLLSILL